MKARLLGRRDTYQIFENDESELIPKEVYLVVVYHVPGNRLSNIKFEPQSKYRQQFKRLNPRRTQEEMLAIVNHLEASLVDKE